MTHLNTYTCIFLYSSNFTKIKTNTFNQTRVIINYLGIQSKDEYLFTLCHKEEKKVYTIKDHNIPLKKPYMSHNLDFPFLLLALKDKKDNLTREERKTVQN